MKGGYDDTVGQSMNGWDNVNEESILQVGYEGEDAEMNIQPPIPKCKDE